jgi:cytochrome b561
MQAKRSFVPLEKHAIGSTLMAEKTSYGKFDKFIHWLMALNIGLTLIFSRGMSSLPDAERVLEYGDHGMSVTTIAACLFVRILWRAKEGFPSLPETMGDAARMVAKSVHYGLYILLASQVLVGVLLASTIELEFIASGYDINYSSWNLVADEYHDILLDFHIGIYWTIVAVLALHILAAVKHHVIDKDEILLRMLPFSGR